MSDRDIKKLDEAFDRMPQPDKGPVPADPRSAALPASRPPAITVDYPDPTQLSQILRDVAKWSGYAFVMEPATNVRLQIFAPERLAPHQAYELFLASLSVVGLRAVQIGKVVKIVPVTPFVAA